MQYLLLDNSSRAGLLTPALLDAEKKVGGPGHRKVLDMWKHSAAAGYEWAWIDTMCIDKSSSAELSEAINSMYIWYKSADVCIVYTSDVSAPLDLKSPNSEFSSSNWWTRGWTFQELLAPKNVGFVDSHWQWIGSKSVLAPLVQSITGIDLQCLLYERQLSSYWISTRMSWAASRQTSRVENTAYCLLGIFGINMPLLYGEGDRAFKRLCKAIMEQEKFEDAVLAHSGPFLFPSGPAEYNSRTPKTTSPHMERRKFQNLQRGLRYTYSVEVWKSGVKLTDAAFSETPDGRDRIVPLRSADFAGDISYIWLQYLGGPFWRKRAVPQFSNETREGFERLFDPTLQQGSGTDSILTDLPPQSERQVVSIVNLPPLKLVQRGEICITS